jgi:hypothetical protein
MSPGGKLPTVETWRPGVGAARPLARSPTGRVHVHDGHLVALAQK